MLIFILALAVFYLGGFAYFYLHEKAGKSFISELKEENSDLKKKLQQAIDIRTASMEFNRYLLGQLPGIDYYTMTGFNNKNYILCQNGGNVQIIEKGCEFSDAEMEYFGKPLLGEREEIN